MACKVHSCSAKLARWHTSPWSWSRTTCAAIARAPMVAQVPSGLVITHLVQLVKRRNVVNQAGQFSARGPVHTMVQLNGFTLYGGK